MKQVEIDAQGNVIDKETRKIVAKKVNGKIVPIEEEKPQEQQADRHLTLEERLRGTNGDVFKTNQEMQFNQEQPQQPPEQLKPSSIKKEITKYEVKKDTSFYIKFCLLDKDERIIVIPITNSDDFPKAEKHWVKFRMWNYNEELSWKDQCMKFNNDSRSFTIDTNKLNELKVKNLILDWSFGEHSDSLKLLHTDGRLSDESYETFKGFFPNIINSILHLMNEVLENNG